MNAAQINELTKIVDDNEFHLGTKELAYKMKNHKEPDKRVDLCPLTIL